MVLSSHTLPFLFSLFDRDHNNDPVTRIQTPPWSTPLPTNWGVPLRHCHPANCIAAAVFQQKKAVAALHSGLPYTREILGGKGLTQRSTRLLRSPPPLQALATAAFLLCIICALFPPPCFLAAGPEQYIRVDAPPSAGRTCMLSQTSAHTRAPFGGTLIHPSTAYTTHQAPQDETD